MCGFFPESFVEKAWNEGREVDLTLAVEVYLQACQEWGRAHLSGFDDVERLSELAEQVVDQTPSIGAPLFAGWRTLPRAQDAPARLAQVMTTLRELRGAMHLAAVMASGLTPREAIVSGPGGGANASFFGCAVVATAEDRYACIHSPRAAADPGAARPPLPDVGRRGVFAAPR